MFKLHEMKFLIAIIIAVIAIHLKQVCAQDLPYKNKSLSIDERVTDLLSRMTLDEKLAQVMHGNAFYIVEDGKFSEEKMVLLYPYGIGMFGRTSLSRTPHESAEFNNAIQRYMLEKTRLGIPALIDEEALHGLMAFGATSFPQAIALGSTWDTALIEQVFTAASLEMRSRGSNHALSPVLDLAREPRFGRTEESFGEDPYLATQMGIAAVYGLQGRDSLINHAHVLATGKHFAAYGQPEGGLNYSPINYSERILRESFFVPFKYAIQEANLGCVMVSYNEIDGVPNHINSWLLKDILREEWGFEGLVISDGGGISQLYEAHYVAKDTTEAARMALLAGIDHELDRCFHTLKSQILDGRIDRKEIDRAVTNILTVKFRLGLFDNPYVDPDYAEKVNNRDEHKELAKKTSDKAIILLKNDNQTLPLNINEIESIAVIGPNAADLHLGGYSYDPNGGYSILEGIKEKVGHQIQVNYSPGGKITDSTQGYRGWWEDTVMMADPLENERLLREAIKIAKSSDVILLALGGNESTCREGWSAVHLGDRDDLNLLGNQDELVKEMLKTGKPVIVILINGRPLSINYIAQNVPAILEGWYLGQETGRTVADVIFGDVNPGGKLPVTFPKNVGQLPVYYNYKPMARQGYIRNEAKPLYPFGHGLSYSHFEYDQLEISHTEILPDENLYITFKLTNTGEYTGDEVVQLYIRDKVSSVTRPVKELKDFKRITLEPGETRQVNLALTPKKLKFYDIHMNYVVEPGEFEIFIGSSSEDIRLTGTFSVLKSANQMDMNRH